MVYFAFLHFHFCLDYLRSLYTSFSYRSTICCTESQNNSPEHKIQPTINLQRSSKLIITEDPGPRRFRPSPAGTTINIPPLPRPGVPFRRTIRRQLSGGKGAAGQPGGWPGDGPPLGKPDRCVRANPNRGDNPAKEKLRLKADAEGCGSSLLTPTSYS